MDELSATSRAVVAEAAAPAHDDRLAAADRGRLAAERLEVEPPSLTLIIVIGPGDASECREGGQRGRPEPRALQKLTPFDPSSLHRSPPESFASRIVVRGGGE